MINENNVLKEDKMKNIKNKLMNLKYVSTQVKQEILFDVAIDLVSNLNTILNRAYCGEFEAYNSREIRKAFETIDEFDEAAENLELNTLQILKDNGVSESDRYSFLGGNRYFKPLSITEPMQKKILESP